MRGPKLMVGEEVELRCWHRRGPQLVNDWLRGRVTQADQRMAAILLSAEVFAANGWPIADRTLWCAHGSPNVRRPAALPASSERHLS